MVGDADFGVRGAKEDVQVVGMADAFWDSHLRSAGSFISCTGGVPTQNVRLFLCHHKVAADSLARYSSSSSNPTLGEDILRF